MSKQIRYTDEPMSYEGPIVDFLPSPEELQQLHANVKVTLALSEESVSYFKDSAQKTGVPYQKLIRQVLDAYAKHQKDINQ